MLLLTGPPFNDNFYTDAAAPTIDGVELSDTIAALSRTDVPPGMPLLAGSNLDEGTEFMSLAAALPCNASQPDFEVWARKQFGDILGAKVLRTLLSASASPLLEDLGTKFIENGELLF